MAEAAAGDMELDMESVGNDDEALLPPPDGAVSGRLARVVVTALAVFAVASVVAAAVVEFGGRSRAATGFRAGALVQKEAVESAHALKCYVDGVGNLLMVQDTTGLVDATCATYVYEDQPVRTAVPQQTCDMMKSQPIYGHVECCKTDLCNHGAKVLKAADESLKCYNDGVGGVLFVQDTAGFEDATCATYVYEDHPVRTAVTQVQCDWMKSQPSWYGHVECCKTDYCNIESDEPGAEVQKESLKCYKDDRFGKAVEYDTAGVVDPVCVIYVDKGKTFHTVVAQDTCVHMKQTPDVFGDFKCCKTDLCNAEPDKA